LAALTSARNRDDVVAAQQLEDAFVIFPSSRSRAKRRDARRPNLIPDGRRSASELPDHQPVNPKHRAARLTYGQASAPAAGPYNRQTSIMTASTTRSPGHFMSDPCPVENCED